MGGNALKNPSVRLQRDEFLSVTHLIVNNLRNFYNTKVRPTLSYKSKKSFGDLDILIEKPDEPYRSDLEEHVKRYFQTTEIVKNKNVWSIGVPLDLDLDRSRVFQVDLIHMKPKHYETSYFYYSYNDLNNLVGKMIHKFGMKFGHKGLIVPLRTDNGGVKREITISKDPQKIYEFIDLDYKKWEEGFEDLEDIFEFVVSSKYFSADMFDDSNLNHRSRVRDKKRKVYQSFREWLKESKHFDRHYNFNLKKEEYIEFIDECFPGVHLRIQKDAFDREMEEKRQIAEKFNGNIIMDLTNLKGKALGKFIGNFKNSVEDFNLWVKHSSKSEIKERILDFYKSQVEFKDTPV
jgi:hypothetical protein